MNTPDDFYIPDFPEEEYTKEQFAALRHWLGKDERNRTLFRQHYLLWKSASVAYNTDRYDTEKAFREFKARHPAQQKRKRTVLSGWPVITAAGFAKAAVILLLVLSAPIAWRMYRTKPGAPQYTRIEVPNGSTAKITLPDSTAVWLNSGSALQYGHSFNRSDRYLVLEGEGYFEVRKNPALPFVVHTERLDVRALGTRFNIHAYQDNEEIRVALKDGSVSVSERAGEGTEVVLAPNRQAIYTKSTRLLAVKEIQAGYIHAWQAGKLHFDRLPLSEISKELHRRYDITIEITDTVLQEKRYYADFDTSQSLAEILNILSTGKKFKYTIHGGKAVISPYSIH